MHTFPRSHHAASVLGIWSSGEIPERMCGCFQPTPAKSCSQCGLPCHDLHFSPYLRELATTGSTCKTQRLLRYPLLPRPDCCFGLSQFGLLHLGHTLGFSRLSLGNHSCPQRHRQPGSITIPISLT